MVAHQSTVEPDVLFDPGHGPVDRWCVPCAPRAKRREDRAGHAFLHGCHSPESVVVLRYSGALVMIPAESSPTSWRGAGDPMVTRVTRGESPLEHGVARFARARQLTP